MNTHIEELIAGTRQPAQATAPPTPDQHTAFDKRRPAPEPAMLELWGRARAARLRRLEEEREKAIAVAEARAERVRFSHD